MVRPIIQDIHCLEGVCTECTPADRILISNMLETYRDTKEEIGFLSANMIGEKKRIFIIYNKLFDWIFINPEIVSGEGLYETYQICYYHKGKRTTKRYRSIDVKFYNTDFEEKTMHFEGDMALKFQHMMDHLEGKMM